MKIKKYTTYCYSCGTSSDWYLQEDKEISGKCPNCDSVTSVLGKKEAVSNIPDYPDYKISGDKILNIRNNNIISIRSDECGKYFMFKVDNKNYKRVYHPLLNNGKNIKPWKAIKGCPEYLINENLDVQNKHVQRALTKQYDTFGTYVILYRGTPKSRKYYVERNSK